MSPANSKVSYDSIMSVMELLKDPKMTFSSVASFTGLSESTIVCIFDKHCHISRNPFPEVICIDEVYTKVNSFNAKYSCIFYDFYNRSIIDVLPDRKKNYLHHYFQSLHNSRELLNVKYVCIDMYLPYKQIAQIYFKKALICVDSFHVIKHLNESLQKLRIRIMKSYSTDSIEYYLLKHWKCLLFDKTINPDNKGKYNKKLARYINYRQLLELILSIHPDLKLAYDLKKNIQSLMLLILMKMRKKNLILSMMNLSFPIFLNTTILLFLLLIGKLKSSIHSLFIKVKESIPV